MARRLARLFFAYPALAGSFSSRGATQGAMIFYAEFTRAADSGMETLRAPGR